MLRRFQRGTNPRQRNEVRRAVADILDRLALGAVALGVLQPLFDPGSDELGLIVGAVTAFVVLALVSLYIRIKTEEE